MPPASNQLADWNAIIAEVAAGRMQWVAGAHGASVQVPNWLQFRTDVRIRSTVAYTDTSVPNYSQLLAEVIMTKVIFLTSGTSWAVPGDFNAANNSIEAIGGSGGGGTGVANTRGGGGGGGGEYRKITNFNPGAGPIAYVIGAAGAVQGNGTDTTFNATSLVAKKGFGSASATGGAGGTGGTGAGGNFNGGTGGDGATGSACGGGGGGGAGGTTAVGGTGSNAVTTTGGNGGAGGATSGGAGGVGGGGGGDGTVWTQTSNSALAGAGGGGGGGNGFLPQGGTAQGDYGGAGSGGGCTAGSGASGATGMAGIIVITYTTA